MNNLFENQNSDIFLTLPNINKPGIRNFINLKPSRRPFLFSKKKYIFSPIKNKFMTRNLVNKSLLEENKTQNIKTSDLNSYFIPENFQEYSTSCNKYQHKLDHVIKDLLSPKNILMKNRRYDQKESMLISDMNKDEIIHRSAGKGMFLRIQKYNKLNRKRPFKLIINPFNNQNNERYIKKDKKINNDTNENGFLEKDINEYNSIDNKNINLNNKEINLIINNGKKEFQQNANEREKNSFTFQN